MYQTSTREEDTDVVDKSIYDDACEAMHHIFPISNPCQLTSVDEKRGKKKDHEGTQAVTQMISTFSTDTCPAPSPLSFFFFSLLLF